MSKEDCVAERTLKPTSKIAYHKADYAIQNVLDLQGEDLRNMNSRNPANTRPNFAHLFRVQSLQRF